MTREWDGDLLSTLAFISETISDDTELLAAHIDDVRAAARHQRVRLNTFAATGSDRGRARVFLVGRSRVPRVADRPPMSVST